LAIAGAAQMTPAAQEAQDLLTLIADTRSSENEACAKIIDAAAERHEQALECFPIDDRDDDDEYALLLCAAMDFRSLAASIPASVTP